MRTVNGHAALVEFLAIAQDVFAHLAQVDVEVATILRGGAIATRIDEGVEHPKFYILYVGRFKVVGVELAHHATPVLFGVSQCAVGLQVVGIEVVWATF